jgi:hypothetical protein
MLIVDIKAAFFNVKQIYFAEEPFDVKKCDMADFVFCTKRVDLKGFKRTEQLTSIIDLTKNIDAIWDGFGKRSCQQTIRRAERAGIKVVISKDFDGFYNIYKQFAKRKGIRPFLGLLDIQKDTLRKYGTLFLAYDGNDILGGDVYLEDKDHILGWFTASRRLEVESREAKLIGMANRLMRWEAIKYAKDKALRDFDWGGLWADEEAEGDPVKKGINSFKLSFGGDKTMRYSYEKIYSTKYLAAQYAYGNLTKILQMSMGKRKSNTLEKLGA